MVVYSENDTSTPLEKKEFKVGKPYNLRSNNKIKSKNNPNAKYKNYRDLIKDQHIYHISLDGLKLLQDKGAKNIKTKDLVFIPDINIENDKFYKNVYHINNISINKALKSDDSQKWIDAMKKEYNNLISHDTWVLEPTEIITYDERRKIVKTMWVLTIKRDSTYKARLVARGDTQPDDTYNETYASTLSYESLRIILSECIQLGFEIEMMDISNAYVNADIDTTIYIQLPPDTPFIQVKNYDGHKMYGHKLLKSLYGLKQSGRNWQLLLEEKLKSFGFEKWSDVDCIMRKTNDEGMTTAIVGYFVDDLIIGGNREEVDKIMNDIKTNFKCTTTEFDDNGYRNILGIDIRITDDHIELNQTKYIDALSERFNIKTKEYVTPINEGFYFNPFNKDLELGLSKLNGRIKWMRQIIGALLFVAGATRPDIQYAVNYLARFVLTPHDEIIKEAERILKYLLSTKELKIFYYKNVNNSLVGYSDADHSGDKSDFISVKGSIFIYGGGPISWRSKKGRVCQSSTDSEINAFIQTCNMSVKLRRILKFIYGYEHEENDLAPTFLYCDNNSALRMAVTGNVSNVTNYLTQDAYIAYQYFENGVINPKKIETKFNLADILTKPVKGPTMKFIRDIILQ